MSQCRFCKKEREVNKDGICLVCEHEIGVTTYREANPIFAFLFLFIMCGICVGVILGFYWVFTHFPLFLGVSHE